MLEATNACANTDLHENDHEVSKVFVDLCHIQHSSCVPIVINESALCYSKDASHNKQQAKNSCDYSIRVVSEHSVPIELPIQETLQNNNRTSNREHSNIRSETNMQELFPSPHMS